MDQRITFGSFFCMCDILKQHIQTHTHTHTHTHTIYKSTTLMFVSHFPLIKLMIINDK